MSVDAICVSDSITVEIGEMAAVGGSDFCLGFVDCSGLMSGFLWGRAISWATGVCLEINIGQFVGL